MKLRRMCLWLRNRWLIRNNLQAPCFWIMPISSAGRSTARQFFLDLPLRSSSSSGRERPAEKKIDWQGPRPCPGKTPPPPEHKATILITYIKGKENINCGNSVELRRPSFVRDWLTSLINDSPTPRLLAAKFFKTSTFPNDLECHIIRHSRSLPSIHHHLLFYLKRKKERS